MSDKLQFVVTSGKSLAKVNDKLSLSDIAPFPGGNFSLSINDRFQFFTASVAGGSVFITRGLGNPETHPLPAFDLSQASRRQIASPAC